MYFPHRLEPLLRAIPASTRWRRCRTRNESRDSESERKINWLASLEQARTAAKGSGWAARVYIYGFPRLKSPPETLRRGKSFCKCPRCRTQAQACRELLPSSEAPERMNAATTRGTVDSTSLPAARDTDGTTKRQKGGGRPILLQQSAPVPPQRRPALFSSSAYVALSVWMCATISFAALALSASKSYLFSTRSFCTRSLNVAGARLLTRHSRTFEIW